MNIDDITKKNVTGVCKESGKPVIDGKCICSGETTENNCKCQINIRQILPFLIQNARFYKGFSL